MNDNKVVVVTGGTRGVGRVLVQSFQGLGWRVAGLARHRPADLADSGAVLFLEANVTQPDTLAGAVARINQNWGRLDVWINNAGFGKLIPFDKAGEADWAEVFNVNFWGVVHGCRLAIAAMLADGKGGSIINIASLAGIHACPNHSAYATSKAAVLALTRSLAVEYADRNIRINAIAPGPIDTEGFRASGGDPKKRAQSIPTRSMVAPQEVAEACLFLTKPLPSVTGHTLIVDGGSAAIGCYAGFPPR